MRAYKFVTRQTHLPFPVLVREEGILDHLAVVTTFVWHHHSFHFPGFELRKQFLARFSFNVPRFGLEVPCPVKSVGDGLPFFA
jgi:hypothetical protein